MKNSYLALVSLLMFSCIASAQVSKPKVNQRALSILLENSGKISELDQTTLKSNRLSTILAQSLVTGAETNLKVTNSCVLDSSDNVFKCVLSIVDRDDDNSSESQTSIRYQLEVDEKSKLPSRDMLFLSVDIERAG